MRKKNNIKQEELEKKSNFNLLLLSAFFVGVILIIASYAWFYATLDVKIKFFKMVVSNESGLFISLDGKNFYSSVEVSKDSIISNLNELYPNHINQWANKGLFAISSNGIKHPDVYQFDMYFGSGYGKTNEEVFDKYQEEYENCVDECESKCENEEDETSGIDCYNSCTKECENTRNFFGTKASLDTKNVKELRSNPSNYYIAFDFFLKNVSGSPKSDNLYFDEGTSIYYNDENKTDEDGVINSLRIGFVKIGSVPLKSNINTIQNITCNNKCEMIIYEPNSTIHSESSIKRATKYGVNLIDGERFPTYAVIAEGDELELSSGYDSNVELDTEHFALQNTITDMDFSKPIFTLPNAITKMRAYIWIEGQDIDSLETRSSGGNMSIVINLIKDLAGYY